jgi:hypothetical protein
MSATKVTSSSSSSPTTITTSSSTKQPQQPQQPIIQNKDPQYIDIACHRLAPHYFSEAALWKYKDIPYNTGFVTHAFSFSASNCTLSIRVFEIDSIGPDKYRYTPRVVSENLIAYSEIANNTFQRYNNKNQKQKMDETGFQVFMSNVVTGTVMLFNSIFHFSVNDYRVEDGFVRIKLNHPYVPNNCTPEIYELLLDYDLYNKASINQHVLLPIHPNHDPNKPPAVFLTDSQMMKTQINLLNHLTPFIAKEKDTILTFINPDRCLDFRRKNLKETATTGATLHSLIKLSSSQSTISTISSSSSSSNSTISSTDSSNDVHMHS